MLPTSIQLCIFIKKNKKTSAGVAVSEFTTREIYTKGQKMYHYDKARADSCKRLPEHKTDILVVNTHRHCDKEVSRLCILTSRTLRVTDKAGL